jgi:hypothetical protein
MLRTQAVGMKSCRPRSGLLTWHPSASTADSLLLGQTLASQFACTRGWVMSDSCVHAMYCRTCSSNKCKFLGSTLVKGTVSRGKIVELFVFDCPVYSPPGSPPENRDSPEYSPLWSRDSPMYSPRGADTPLCIHHRGVETPQCIHHRGVKTPQCIHHQGVETPQCIHHHGVMTHSVFITRESTVKMSNS